MIYQKFIQRIKSYNVQQLKAKNVEKLSMFMLMSYLVAYMIRIKI